MNQESTTNKFPLISVITVTFNAAASVEDTIKSVINQTYSNIEYIIVDGGSTDGTIDVINKYKLKIKNIKVISEPDNGIFDAMNKGLKLANGEWINFMNAGDSFVNNDVISKLFSHNNIASDIIFGNTIMNYSNNPKPFKTVLNAKTPESIWNGTPPFCHQSMFSKRSLHILHPFDISFTLGADFEFICWALENKCSFTYIPIEISQYEAGGKSYTNYISNIKNRWCIVKRYKKSIFKDILFINMIILFIIKEFMKKILPEYILKHYIEKKYKFRKQL